MSHILDASALLALLQGEPGARLVAEHLDGAVIAAANLAEVATKYDERGADVEQLASFVDEFGLEVIPMSRQQALMIGKLRSETRRAGLSLGDRACLALAMERPEDIVLTADRAWQELDLGLEIEMVR